MPKMLFALCVFCVSIAQGDAVYNFQNINTTSSAANAFVCDVDVFPFSGNQFNLNSKIEVSDLDYIQLASSDSNLLAIPSAGRGDEVLLWFEQQISENPSLVKQLSFEFSGISSQNDLVVEIYAMKHSSVWTANSSFVKIGGSATLFSGQLTSVVRTTNINISDYIDPATGVIQWCVYQFSPSNAAFSTDYVELKTFTQADCNAIVYLPADFNKDCQVDFSDLSLLSSEWMVSACNLMFDFNSDCQINLTDLHDFSPFWMQCSNPNDPGCDNFWTRRFVGIWYETWYAREGNYTWIMGHGVGSDTQLMGDVNGDGKSDAIVFMLSSGSWYVAISNGDGFNNYSQWANGEGAGSDNQLVGDVNGDGKADLLHYNMSSGSWYVGLSNGVTFNNSTQWATGHGVGSSKQFLTDVNGDGKDDAVVFFDGFMSGSWWVALSNGSGFDGFQMWKSGFGTGSGSQLIADVDGDIKADAVVFYADGSWYVCLSNGTSFGVESLWAIGHGVGSNNRFLGDVDGDGRADSVAYFDSGGQWWSALSNGTLFQTPFKWKENHGDGNKKINELASYFELQDATGDGLDDPVTYYSSEGMWKILPASAAFVPAAYNTWHAWDMRYIPYTLGEYRQYDTFEPNVIDEHLAMMANAGIDYLILDQTNHIDQFFIKPRAISVCNRIAQWNLNNPNKKIKYACAVGGTQFTADPATLEYEASVVWNEFLGNPDCLPENYFNLNGKPFLIAYGGARDIWENWTGNKTFTNAFTVHFAEGMVGGLGAWAWGNWRSLGAQEYGLYYGWAFPEGSMANIDNMVVMPGWDNHIGGIFPFVSRTYNGLPGGFYIKQCWDRVLQNMPDRVVINSFNEYAEDTAIAPSDTSQLGSTGEIWLDPNSLPSEFYYWDMTRNFIKEYKSTY